MPLSNLDAKLRVEMRLEIRRLQQANGTTSVYVTHDQEEAFSISDRVAIMHHGRIMQFDTPEILYRRPANAFVARFVGFETLLPMVVLARNGALVEAQAAGGVKLRLDDSVLGPIPDHFVLACRPEGLGVTAGTTGIPAVLGLRTYLGRAYQYQYQCEAPAGALVANGPLDQPFQPGTKVQLELVPEQCAILKRE